MRKPLASNAQRSNSREIWQNLNELEYSYVEKYVLSSLHKPPKLPHLMFVTLSEIDLIMEH